MGDKEFDALWREGLNLGVIQEAIAAADQIHARHVERLRVVLNCSLEVAEALAGATRLRVSVRIATGLAEGLRSRSLAEAGEDQQRSSGLPYPWQGLPYVVDPELWGAEMIVESPKGWARYDNFNKRWVLEEPRE